MPAEPSSSILTFLPECVQLIGLLALFIVTLGHRQMRLARTASLVTAIVLVLAVLFSLKREAILFDGAYQVDAFSQGLKLIFALGYLSALLVIKDLKDIRGGVQPEYFFLFATSVTGFLFLASSIELITLVVSLELSSFPLFLMIAMRREINGQRSQMESAIKYMMFGIAATGLMLFGMAYLYGLTGTTSIPLLAERLQDVLHSPLALAGITLTLAAFLYKLAVFPFHFWTPDVYQGASNETTAIIASIPKVAAVLLMLRFVGAAHPGMDGLVLILACLAVGSMFYGNLLALVQTDFKRLLGFSAIAHAGYTLVGITTLGAAGYTAALYYVCGYLFMVLACFTVIARVSEDGSNLSIRQLAGLHQRSPLLALTLLVGVFSLAGIPPFVGFMGKFSLLTAAMEQGLLWLVLLTVLNAVIAVYYYLRVLHSVFFVNPEEGTASAPITLDLPTRILCLFLMGIIIALGTVPGVMIDWIQASLHSIIPG